MNSFKASVDFIRILSLFLVAGFILSVILYPPESAQTATSASTAQTDDGTTNTGFNLTGNTKSQVGVIGTSNAARVELATTSIAWYATTTDTTGGNWSSLSLGSDGFARIAYLVGGNLKFIRCLNSSCSSRNTNTIYNGALGGDVGKRFVSLALGSDGLARVAYFAGALTHVGFSRCLDADCSSGNATSTIVAINSPSNYYVPIALALDSANLPRIINIDTDDRDRKLYACNDINCQTATTTSFGAGIYLNDSGGVSIEIGTDNLPRIVWVRNQASSLEFIKCANADCSSNASSTISVNAVYENPLVLSGGDLGRVAFRDDNRFHFVECTNADCSTKSATQQIDAPYPAQVGNYPSLALGSDGFARMSYYDGDVGDLKFAQCSNASCSTYATTTVDSAGIVGKMTSIKIGTGSFADLARISYYDTTNDDLKYAYQYIPYQSSGTFTSGAIDTGGVVGSWGLISWNATTPSGTSVSIKARSANDSSMSGATAFASCSNITNGADISSGGCVYANHRYIQYQATLSTTDNSVTPSLDDLTMNYSFAESAYRGLTKIQRPSGFDAPVSVKPSISGLGPEKHSTRLEFPSPWEGDIRIRLLEDKDDRGASGGGLYGLTYKDISAKEGQTIEMQDDTGRCGIISRCYIQAYDFAYGFESVLTEIPVSFQPSSTIAVTRTATKTPENQTTAQQSAKPQQRPNAAEIKKPQIPTKDQNRKIQELKIRLVEIIEKLIKLLQKKLKEIK